VRGAGNNCRHPFISQQVFEKKLRPAAGEVLSPVRNRPTAHGAEEATTSERLGGQHAGLDLGRERQNALLRFPVADRIVNLHEIWLLARDHRFHGGKIAVEGWGHTNVPADALRLPRLERRPRLPPIAYGGELEQVT